MIFSEKAKSNNAFYYEVCMLKLLSDMGYLNEKDLNAIIKIASEDYGASLVLGQKFIMSELINLTKITGYIRTIVVL